MEPELRAKLAIYDCFAATGVRPSIAEIAMRLGVDVVEARRLLAALCAQRVLVLEADGESIRMAPPFSGVPTQHRVVSSGTSYFANCAWDSLGVAAALRRPAVVSSRCEQSLEPLELQVGTQGPGVSSWLFHSVVPASKWWADIVFT